LEHLGLNSLVDCIKFLFSAYTKNMIEVFKVRHLGHIVRVHFASSWLRIPMNIV
ncbi:hypothetical protein L9F63_014467, partial [Diploptera punctata]